MLENKHNNTLQVTLERLGFIRSWLNEKPQDDEKSLDSYHLELASPATNLKSRYMLSVFDPLFKQSGDINRELTVTFETLDKDTGDHDEVVVCHIESDEFLKHIR